MTHGYHITNETHHHHSHTENSQHNHGCHVFQLEDVSVSIENKVYRKRKIFPEIVSTVVLNNCNLSLHEGEILFLIGESGSGKSMLVSLLTGTLPKNSNVAGKIWLSGEEVQNRVQNISYVPQSLKSLDPLVKYSYQKNEHYPHEMSGGMCRIALIEDSIARGSKVVIADEPTEGLDAKKSQEVMGKLIEGKGGDGCLLVITHDLSLALKYADRLAIFKDGTIVEETSAKSFKDGNLEHDFAKRMWECMPEKVSFPKSEIQSSKQIIIDNLSVKFGDKCVVKGMSYTINASDITCFFGDTGSGKSTLCKTIAGWTKPTEGSVCAPHNVQYIPQNPFDSFDPKLTIRKSMVAIDAQASLMAAMNVSGELLDRKPTDLSGGELQRFAIMRAISASPDFLILDEATSMLDVVTQKEILDFVLQKRKKLSFGLIFVTHDEHLCKKLADKVILF